MRRPVRQRAACLAVLALIVVWPLTAVGSWPQTARAYNSTAERNSNSADAAPTATEAGTRALTVLALCISGLALVVALKNYRRKSGMYVRGAYTPASSRASEDDFVSEIVLENLKDRAVTIFEIYLKIGHNYYVQIEDLGEQPLVLKPFETYRKEFGPLEFYAVNANKIILNDLLRDPAVKKRLVLSTSDGKYKVRSRIRRWSPIVEMFQNHLTGVVRPISSTIKNTYVGGNMAYVIEFVGRDGKEEIVPIHPRDYELKIFKRFSLSAKSLKSKADLEHLLHEQMDKGNLACKSFVVYDLNELRKEAHDFYSGQVFRAKRCSAFQYYVMGWAATKYSDWKLERENARRRHAQQEKQK